MTPKEIRGVFYTLEDIANSSRFCNTIIEDKPIGYWTGFIAGYMVASIMSANDFNEDLSERAPLITELMYKCRRREIVNENEKAYWIPTTDGCRCSKCHYELSSEEAVVFYECPNCHAPIGEQEYKIKE